MWVSFIDPKIGILYIYGPMNKIITFIIITCMLTLGNMVGVILPAYS